jgi:hypothetical protein
LHLFDEGREGVQRVVDIARGQASPHDPFERGTLQAAADCEKELSHQGQQPGFLD